VSFAADGFAATPPQLAHTRTSSTRLRRLGVVGRDVVDIRGGLTPLGECGAVEGITRTQEALVHANAPLTVEGRRRLCGRIGSGWSITAAAEASGVSRQSAHKWWRRYQLEGEAGLVDRSSCPRSCPHQTPARVERIEAVA